MKFMSIDIKKVGDFIKDIREKSDLTQSKLADMVGTSSKTISKWENGHGFPDVIYQMELCKILNITLEELHTGQYNIKKRKSTKIIKISLILLLVFASILLIISSFLSFYYFKNIGSNNLYNISSKDNEAGIKLFGLMYESPDIITINISRLFFDGIDIIQNNFVNIELYKDDKLVYRTNNILDIEIRIKNNKKFDPNNYYFLVNILNNDGEILEYKTNFQIRKVNDTLNTESLSNKNGDNNTEIIKTLKKLGYKFKDEAWILENKKKNNDEMVMINLNDKSIMYRNETKSLNKMYFYVKDLNLIEVYVYNIENSIRTLINSYSYNFENDEYICGVGACAGADEVLKFLEKYTSLLNVDS